MLHHPRFLIADFHALSLRGNFTSNFIRSFVVVIIIIVVFAGRAVPGKQDFDILVTLQLLVVFVGVVATLGIIGIRALCCFFKREERRRNLVLKA